MNLNMGLGKYSTDMAMLELVDRIHTALDNNEYGLGIFFTYPKPLILLIMTFYSILLFFCFVFCFFWTNSYMVL